MSYQDNKQKHTSCIRVSAAVILLQRCCVRTVLLLTSLENIPAGLHMTIQIRQKRGEFDLWAQR